MKLQTDCTACACAVCMVSRNPMFRRVAMPLGDRLLILPSTSSLSMPAPAPMREPLLSPPWRCVRKKDLHFPWKVDLVSRTALYAFGNLLPQEKTLGPTSKVNPIPFLMYPKESPKTQTSAMP